MKLNRLKCVNFRCFRNREFIFQDGITGIIGSNGSGKSRIVEAICFLFTGVVEKGSKEDAITVGEATGYVTGEFEIDGVIGTLERHLDASKVRLQYGDKDLKKVGEVNELWAKLLQINSEIFNNVIVSKQGDIPKLFSGDKADRISIFQKIFLVPNTEKLRDVIWKDYIKMLPPLFPVDDLQQINKEIAEKQAQLLVGVDSLQSYKDYTLQGYQENEAALAALRLSLVNKRKQDDILISHAELAVQIDTANTKIRELFTDIQSAPFKLEQLKEQLIKFERAKTQVEAKGRLDTQVASLTTALQPFNITELNGEYQNLAAANTVYHQQISVLEASVSSLNSQIRKYSNFSGKESCPTCGQAITEITKILTDLQADLASKVIELNRLKSDHDEVKKRLTTVEATRQNYNKTKAELDTLTGQLKQYALIEYNAEEHELYKGVYAKLEKSTHELQEKQHAVKLLVEKLEGCMKLHNSLETGWTHLSVFDLEGRIKNAEHALESFKLNWQQKQDLERTMSVIEAEIGNLNRRIEQSKSSREKNEKRNQLEKILLSLYDAFHSNQFSKKVIQRYSSVVTDYLLDNLSKFSLPYTANVNEDFAIDVLNNRGQKLPIVSGGQAMMIGLCLRLALLQLFAQNFSFIVIDEGSTGLHKINSDIYFDLIKQFPRSQFRQIFIVDHNEKLAEVVDHVVNLDEV